MSLMSLMLFMLNFLQDKLSAILKTVKDLLFPVFCLSCQIEGHWLCSSCLEQLKKEIKPQFFCPHCYQDNQDGRTCLACRPFSFLDGAISSASYSQEIIAKMVQLLKYNYLEEMGEVFGELIKSFVDKMGKISLMRHSRESGNQEKFELLLDPCFRGDDTGLGTTDYDSKFIIHNSEFVILPVPLHRRRYLERGFNQAEIIARAWSKHLSLPMLKNVLVRSRPTLTQVGLGRAERQKNLVGAFKLKQPIESPGVILIDDVFTTGSTLQECARVLKEGGAKEVWGVTIAREI